MTLEQMRQATQILFDTFPSANKEARLRAFMEFFADKEYPAVRAAARRISEKGDRMPTNAEFSAALSSVYLGSKELQAAPVDCEHCSKSGVVHAKDAKGFSWAYRCKCSNGSRFPNYPQWFGEARPGKRLDKVEQAPF